MEARCAESCWRPSGPLLFLLLGSISSFRSWTASRRELQSACVRLERSSPRACRCGSARAPHRWSVAPPIPSSSFSSVSSSYPPPDPHPPILRFLVPPVDGLAPRAQVPADGSSRARRGRVGAGARGRRIGGRWLLLFPPPPSPPYPPPILLRILILRSFDSSFRPWTASRRGLRCLRTARAELAEGVSVREREGAALVVGGSLYLLLLLLLLLLLRLFSSSSGSISSFRPRAAVGRGLRVGRARLERVLAWGMGAGAQGRRVGAVAPPYPPPLFRILLLRLLLLLH